MKNIILISIFLLLNSCGNHYIKKNKINYDFPTSFFQLIDKNKDHFLNVKEFSLFFLLNNKNKNRVNSLYAECDSQPFDHKITKKESIACGAEDDEFEQADTNRNKTVDPIEFVWIITKITFRKADKNKDKKLSFSEFNNHTF
jgi:hypothetical protein